jgi:hypothetical protein
MNKLIECLVCGRNDFSNIATHLKKHDLTAKMYLQKYPNAKLVSDDFQRKQKQMMRARYKRTDVDYRMLAGGRTFDFIKNKELSIIIQRDYKSAKICLVNRLWKPAIVIYGSILEAILIEKTKENSFSRALETAYSRNDISEKEYHKIHIIKNLRNFVHLHLELSEGEEINEYWAKTFSDICESIIKRFKQEIK